MSDMSALFTLLAIAALLVLAIASAPISRSLSIFFHGQRNRRSK